MGDNLALDVSLVRPRALHRVWRALNDGDCSKCHQMHAATEIIRDPREHPADEISGIACPSCGFKVLYSEIQDIEELFAPAMDAATVIFEEWQAERKTRKAHQ